MRLILFFSVFWDLYCAAPERRENCDHSSEAKAFHDYASIIVPNSSNGSSAICMRQHLYLYS